VSLEPPPSVKYRLCLNENLFLPRELVAEVVREAAESVDPRLYHDAYGEELAERLAEFHRVDVEEIVIGPGADYLIYLLASYSRVGGAVIVEPTFEEYRRAVQLYGGRITTVLLDDDFRLKPERLKGAAASIAYLASPNNPTGNQFERGAVEDAIESFRGIVVVDEAYAEYARYSMLSEAIERDNLVVIRTFSKAWGLAGLRVGYLVTNRRLASELKARGRVFACSSLSLKAASLMLERWEAVRRAIEELKAVREWLRRELTKIGVKAYPSDANFLLVRLPVDSGEVCTKLLEKGIAVKNVSSLPLCDNCIRVTIPPKPIAEIFINALSSVLEQSAL